MPAPKGPRTRYRPKAYPPIPLLLTAAEKRLLEDAARRTGETRSEVVEKLLRTHGGGLAAVPARTAAPGRPMSCVSLTQLAKDVLDAGTARCGVSRGEFVGRLLALHGRTVRFAPVPAHEEPAAVGV